MEMNSDGLDCNLDNEYATNPTAVAINPELDTTNLLDTTNP